MNKKIKTQPEIIKIVRELKKQGKIIATMSGSFDILHAGHVKSLKEAKTRGDVLIVLLNSDISVRGYKGSKRPIISEQDRAEMLAALECVDYVVLFDELNVKKIIGKIKPDIHCQGADWGKDCVERKTVEDLGGEIYVLKWTIGLSTSKLIKKIIEVYSEPVNKAIFINSSIPVNNQVAKEEENEHRIVIAELNMTTIMRAVKKYDISLNDSWIISDKIEDIVLGKEINAKTIKIGNKLPKEMKLNSDYYSNDFSEAINTIKAIKK